MNLPLPRPSSSAAATTVFLPFPLPLPAARAGVAAFFFDPFTSSPSAFRFFPFTGVALFEVVPVPDSLPDSIPAWSRIFLNALVVTVLKLADLTFGSN